MPSFSTVLAAATLLLSSVHAQKVYHIEPESVPLSLRDNWCDQEKSTCPIICQQSKPGGYEVNECDPETLTYGCVCDSGMSPNLSEYSLTLPFFICQEWGTQCVANCGANTACASDCRENNPCGALNPTRVNETTTSTMTTASKTSTPTPGQVFDGLGGDSDSDSDSDSNSDDDKSGASSLHQYGSLAGGIALAAVVGAGTLLL